VRDAANSSIEELRADGVETPAVAFDGPETLQVMTDPDLLTLALRNGIRNALEASLEASDPVVVSWDQSSVEFWVAVLDFGIGLPPEGKALFDIGSTTKPQHLGIGLAIVEQVASTLNAIPSLESLPDGATRFQLTIKRVES
jgi:signal transduction histidine kinase